LGNISGGTEKSNNSQIRYIVYVTLPEKTEGVIKNGQGTGMAPLGTQDTERDK
jgi:hypothetical protein